MNQFLISCPNESVLRSFLLKMRTVVSATGNDHNKPTEVVAYAIERQMTGRGNPLTEAIYAVLKEKGAIK